MLEGSIGRYRSPMPIRCRGALHLYSARDGHSDRLHVIVMAPRLPSTEARVRLGNLARVQRLVAGDRVPAVVDAELEGPTPWVALDCDGVADLEHVGEFVLQGGDKVDYERGSSLGKLVMETLAACHRIRDPKSGRPVCLGSLAAANLLFAADGRTWIVGFGAGPFSDACISPEVAFGEAPTPGADVYAVTLFIRAQTRFVNLSPIVKRIFAGHPQQSDADLLATFLWSNLKILAGTPAERPDMDATLAQAQHAWQALGFTPDLEGFAAWIARAIAVDPERLADAPTREGAPHIRIGRDGDWLETPNGMRHALATRRPLRRLLVALAEAHRSRAGVALTVDELLHAGWPGEDPLPEAGSNRVYVAISTLRKLGLSELLQRWDGGYRLDPAVQCQF